MDAPLVIRPEVFEAGTLARLYDVDYKTYCLVVVKGYLPGGVNVFYCHHVVPNEYVQPQIRLVRDNSTAEEITAALRRVTYKGNSISRCESMRYSIFENFQCVLLPHHPGSCVFARHDCPRCGVNHGCCSWCGCTHGERHMPNCFHVAGPVKSEEAR